MPRHPLLTPSSSLVSSSHSSIRLLRRLDRYCLVAADRGEQDRYRLRSAPYAHRLMSTPQLVFRRLLPQTRALSPAKTAHKNTSTSYCVSASEVFDVNFKKLSMISPPNISLKIEEIVLPSRRLFRAPRRSITLPGRFWSRPLMSICLIKGELHRLWRDHVGIRPR
ncbi:hypothetical protein Bbelb_286550 [Branchiostoma belcheri]|nr:hypothetical protein Bbelb_286550 [Branchiostoma belcheri]